ncbi:MAG TPA: preprotein translocase subunit SecG [Alphaproteobacteria bacterium]|nr:preprotein translocase subunit SecG [Alphaproteobacteria bacterium]HCS22695.1 preprotein translocase subunit SecG [Rhodospirillaceae bacterium]HRI77578.1 preprotein translocase subunit SecG [Alphaproteobacteria bacterium]HRJ65613.1 preprotein translocase subunit SecG [Alphaproteobacteria bacterium]
MQEVLLVIHLIVALGIIAVVLLQPSESGGFSGNSGSMSNLMAPRRTADALTRVTTILAGLFFCTSLLLAITASSRPKAEGILEMGAQKPAAIEKAEKSEAAPADVAPEEKAAVETPEEPATPKAPIGQ